MKSLLSLALFFTVSASAQTAIPTEFPVDAVPLSAPALTEKLSGKVFVAKMTDGTDWRYQFQGGFLFFNISSGYSDSESYSTSESEADIPIFFPTPFEELYFPRSSNEDPINSSV